MRITFNIDYHTNFGEQVFISGNIPELGDNDPHKALPLDHLSGERNSVSIDLSPAISGISYRYFIRREDGTDRQEWGENRTLRFDPHVPEAEVFDHWQDQQIGRASCRERV